MTKREATEKWVGEFNAIPQGMIAKLWQANIDDMHELTNPRVGDVVWSSSQQDAGEIVHIYDTGEPEADVRFGVEVETLSLDDIAVERDDRLPMWGTMWSFGDSCDNYWLEEQDGIQVMSDHGFRIYEHEEFGYFFGIDGAGYNFYDQHWVPLYEARGLQWHDKEVEKMTVLIVEPGKTPCETEIDGGLESLQKTVGGDIQAVYPYAEPVALICHEEGKMIGLPLNRALYDAEGQIYDIVAGTFIVCGLSGDNFASLTPEDMARIKEQFHQPEVFAKINGKITAMKVEPEKPSLRDTLKQHAERSKAEFGDQPSKPEKTQDAEL